MFAVTSPTDTILTAEAFIDNDPRDSYKAINITISNMYGFHDHDLTVADALRLSDYLKEVAIGIISR
ncbi:hypothetical protein CIP107510_00542 [Corynebacterium diphtheriae]|uniref:hypothetical protein n=1 Tax=Corynebacterium diphtheriae TaxID=1717 RepID=UPI000A1DAFF5|nr:hypothetical protein [Corynebacterium diphtheriae]MBG9276170.1 hypothetical protein [Corynebacterium diphtheriae bv. mitis]MBG9280564.1 hypothetical protein [Corynebacterium diphtheriae bv. mitis]MBG9303660.1 hypothetical protein [Corynebacterium diphtheriae bv. mitis]OSQ22109.1 hypothetical protein B1A52_00495 [Corynebacterium diphtheriae]CAB0492871.1 hypothetical protein CIP101280_00369 [Corynebacterium diphtheriae]